MWTSETGNDIFNVGLNDDLFVLAANSNSSCQVVVKTLWGSTTNRHTFSDIEMQSGVLTLLKCSVQVDTLGREILQNSEYSNMLYKYKDFVRIFLLSMVDDCLTITSCSLHSVKMNDLVQSKADTKRLELSDVKCFEMHIGDKKTSAPIKNQQQRNA